MSKLFIIILYSNYERTRISYFGLFSSKQEILKNIPILNYNDLIYKPKKYKTCKSLFDCLEVPNHKKHYFNSFHLTNDKRFIQ